MLKSFIFIFSLLPILSWAQSKPQSLDQLLDQVELLSPEVQKARSRFEVTKKRSILARQFPNPDLSFGGWKGKAGNKNWSQTDITLSQPIELGGKRRSRIEVAEAEISEATVQLSVLTAELRLKILFTLYRYRQVLDEIELLKEASLTFLRLSSNYQLRPQLSPEQSTTLFNFQLASSDSNLRMEDAKSELNALESEIRILTGLRSEDIQGLLPKRIKSWPQFDNFKDLNSPNMQILAAETRLSEKELELARADVWPTVNIGPSYTSQRQFGESANILGVMISFPIPIINQNQGARAIASQSIVTSKKLYQLEKNVSEVRRKNLLKTYESSSALLSRMVNNQDLSKRHGMIEVNFLRGLISSPLVLESHRLMIENQRLFHERELKTLDLFYQLVLLEGKKIEGIQ